jgi:glutathione S-transferase
MLEPQLYFVAFVTMMALILYYLQGIKVGIARSTYNIQAPKTTGNEQFERIFRAHYNTLEQLPLFLIPLWLFAMTVSAQWAGWLGILWILGRIGFVLGYYKSAEKRHGFGSGLSYSVGTILILGSFYGIISGLV